MPTTRLLDKFVPYYMRPSAMRPHYASHPVRLSSVACPPLTWKRKIKNTAFKLKREVTDARNNWRSNFNGGPYVVSTWAALACFCVWHTGPITITILRDGQLSHYEIVHVERVYYIIIANVSVRRIQFDDSFDSVTNGGKLNPDKPFLYCRT